MTSEGGIESARTAASWRYGVGVAAAVVGLAVGALLLPLTDVASYTPLVATAAIAVWYGGLGPGLACAAIGWLGGLFVLTEPQWSLAVDTGGDLLRWLTSLLVALIVISVGAALQRTQKHAARRVSEAERSRSSATDLQRLAAALSAALTPSDVAHALVTALPSMLGATGGALGLVEEGSLVVVDPASAPAQTLPPGLRLALSTRAPLTTAARTGAPAYASTREEFEREYPAGAQLAPAAAGALAVPLQVGKRVIGAIGFPFARPGAIDEETIALARIAADLGAQALERSALYEDERTTREGLDRVARLAPRFAGETPEFVVREICREARATFGCDMAQIWNVSGGRRLEVLWRDPPTEAFPAGTKVALDDLAGFAEALERLEPMFVPDVPQTASGDVRPRVLSAGTHSAFRMPIVIGGRVERVLSLLWRRVIPEPSPQTVALARRFADHVGLALEQAERRRAQDAATRSAEQTRRLLAATASLAAAMTPEAVAAATLREAFGTLGASAGVLVRNLGDELEVVSARGYDASQTDEWRRFDLDAAVPLADAVRRNEVIIVGSREDRARDYPLLAGRETAHAAWLAVPLDAGGRPVGALGLSFDRPRAFAGTDLAYASALGRQAGQALDRAILLETEHVARARAERMAGDLAQLHALATSLGTATTSAEVAQLVSERMTAVAGADTAGIYLADEEGNAELLECVGSLAARVQAADRRLTDVPYVADVLRSRSSAWLASDDDWRRFAPGSAWGRHGIGVFGIVPLLAGERVSGLLFAAFLRERPPDESQVRLVETMARLAAQPLERLRLLERERASRRAAELAEARTRRLHEVTARLSRAVTPDEVGLACLEIAAGATGAARGAVALVDGDELVLRPVLGYPPSVIDEHAPLPLDGRSPAGHAIRDDTPVWASDQEATGRYEAMEGFVGAGDRGWVALPLAGSDGPRGALLLGFDEPVDISLADREWLVALAGQCAQALARSSVYDEERVQRRRTERLQRLTAALSGSLTPAEVASVFLDEARAALEADGAAIGVVDAERREIRTVGWRGYPDELMEPWLDYPLSTHVPSALAVQLGRTAYYEEPDELRAAFPGGDETFRRIGHSALAVVPLRAGAAPLGVAVFSWSSPRKLSGDERAFVETLAAQCGQALDRARRYETERTIAETLQRSVLPETLPSMEGVQVAARYLPGTTALDVGGDWFDTITLPDGRLGFVVGDVVGKGVRAASTMAQLRNGMRALTLDAITPGEAVTKLNRLLEGFTDAPFATLAYLTVDPVSYEATVICAGHPPPLVVDPQGSVSFLEGGRGLPLGVDADVGYQAWETALPAGATVVLYTDGLVERRERPIDAGLELLAAAAAGASRQPEALLDEVLAALLEEGRLADDVAVLAFRLDEARLAPLDLTLPAGTESLTRLRAELERWLERAAIPDFDARDVVLAAWEAAANAIEHAQSPADGLVRVRATLTGDRVRVEVADSGRWKEPQPREDRGLGLRLMHALMTVDIDRSDDGTRVVMERPLTRERAGEHAPDPSHG